MSVLRDRMALQTKQSSENSLTRTNMGREGCSINDDCGPQNARKERSHALSLLANCHGDHTVWFNHLHQVTQLYSLFEVVYFQHRFQTISTWRISEGALYGAYEEFISPIPNGPVTAPIPFFNSLMASCEELNETSYEPALVVSDDIQPLISLYAPEKENNSDICNIARTL